MTDGTADSPGQATRRGQRDNGSPNPAETREYSERLAALARFTLRHKALVIGVWLGAAVVLALLFPQLETVVRQQSVDLIPRDAPSLQTVDRMSAAFGEEGSKTMVFVAMEDPNGLTPTARQRYGELVRRLQGEGNHVLLVQDLLSDPITEAQAVSADRKAWYLPVGVTGTLGDPTAAESVNAVRNIAAEVFTGSTTTVQVTGPPATFSDMIASAEHDLLLISIATAGVIALILLIVYRSVFTALLPLLVIGLSLAVGRGVLSALGEMGMPVSQFTVAFMTAILLGAGTDYTVFLISRYHEQRRAQVPADQAVIHATASIGRVILASAATVALAFLAMVFGKLSVFSTLGPACAIAIVIGFLATVTLLPPVLHAASHLGWGAPRADLTRRYWNRIAVLVVRRPASLLAMTLVALLALGAVALGITITYDDRSGQPATTDSNEGYALLDRHFPTNTTVPEFLVIQSPTDMRTAKGLADLDDLASRVAQVPGVTRVVGVTRPTGSRLEQAQLSWQNGQIGDRLATAVSDGRSRTGDLFQLRDGADQLATGLATLDSQIRANLTPLSGILDQATTAGQQIQQYRPLLGQLRTTAPALDQLTAQAPQLATAARQASDALSLVSAARPLLDNAPWCTPLPQCAAVQQQLRTLSTLRDSDFLPQIGALSGQLSNLGTPITTITTQLTTAVDTLDTTLGAVTARDLPAQLAQLQDGVSQLAAGSRAIAGGVAALVDSNLQQLAGMATLAAQLQTTARETRGSDAATGFYLPPDAFANQKFSDVAAQFVSPDGRTVRYAIQSDADPYSSHAIELTNTITTAAQTAKPNTALQNASVSLAGFPAINADLQRLLSHDFRLLALATLIIVGVILIALLRALIAPLYLLGTVILNYGAALGIGVLIFQHILHTEIA
ncbi:MAG: MMPL family transporter [Mycobacterium sp.]|nr:MMPL family transporter [Mycobacterium sp.]